MSSAAFLFGALRINIHLKLLLLKDTVGNYKADICLNGASGVANSTVLDQTTSKEAV